MNKLILIIALVGMTGCSTIAEQQPSIPKAVAILQTSFATASVPADAYMSRPVCGKTAEIICRTPALTKQIIAYGRAAIAAIDASRKVEDQTSLSAAQTVLNAYSDFTNALPKGANP